MVVDTSVNMQKNSFLIEIALYSVKGLSHVKKFIIYKKAVGQNTLSLPC